MWYNIKDMKTHLFKEDYNAKEINHYRRKQSDQ